MRAAVGIGVLASQHPGGINALKHRFDGVEGRDRWRINGYRRRAGELHKPVLNLPSIDVGSNYFQPRIDVPNRSRNAAWNVVRLQHSVLDDVTVGVVRRDAHVHVEAGDDPTVRRGATVHRVRVRLIRVGEAAAASCNAGVSDRVAGADPCGGEHRPHCVVIVKAAVDAAIRSNGARYCPRMAWE